METKETLKELLYGFIAIIIVAGTLTYIGVIF